MRSSMSMLSRIALGLALLALAAVGGADRSQADEVIAQQVGHISNGSGNVESDIETIDFGGGLKSRSLADRVTPGTSEAVAIVVGICDGARINTTSAQILPRAASAPPAVAGGVAAIGCTPSAGTDGLATGINGATIVFSGPLAQYMGTVRMYADVDLDGILFEPGELIRSNTPSFNSGTNQAIASMGRQGQLFTGAGGGPLAALDPTTLAPPPFGPMLVIFTVDIDSNAPSGSVDVALGLGVGDDTAQGGAGICAGALPPVPGGPQNCGSNLTGGGPERDSFNVVGGQSGGGGGPPPGGGGSSIAQELQPYDTNGNDRLEDGEFLNTIDDWVDRQLSDNAFFAAIDIWINQSRISSASAGGPQLQVARTAKGLRFTAPQAASLSLQVFGLDGRRVAHSTAAGSSLSWNLTGDGGRPLANGVYLYRASVTSADGRTAHLPIRKLVVRR